MKKIDFDPSLALKNMILPGLAVPGKQEIKTPSEPEKATSTDSHNKKPSHSGIAKPLPPPKKKTATANLNRGGHKKASRGENEKCVQTVYLPRSLCKKIKLRTVLSEKRRDRNISSIIEIAVTRYLKATARNEKKR